MITPPPLGGGGFPRSAIFLLMVGELLHWIFVVLGYFFFYLLKNILPVLKNDISAYATGGPLKYSACYPLKVGLYPGVNCVLGRKVRLVPCLLVMHWGEGSTLTLKPGEL